MVTSKEKITKTNTSILNAQHIIDKLYDLRKAFEADYSGALRSRKYEATREFTIALNHTIFQANQLLGQHSDHGTNVNALKLKLEHLKQEFTNLVG